jgi:hypothetical protein
VLADELRASIEELVAAAGEGSVPHPTSARALRAAE